MQFTPKLIPASIRHHGHKIGQGINRLKPKSVSIAYKLALVIALLIMAGMSVLGTIIVQQQTRILGQQIQEFGTTVIRQIAETAKEPLLANDSLILGALANNLTSMNNILGTTILDHDGKVLVKEGVDALTTAPRLTPTQESSFGSQTATFEWRYEVSLGNTLTAITLIAPVTFRDVVTGHILLTLDRTPMDRSIQATIRSVITATVLMMLLAALISIWVGKRLTRPITYLVDASEAIRKGQFEHRINERRNDEIGRLITSFNQMADGLLQKIQVERALSRYVSDKVAKTVLSDLEHVELGGQHVEASVLFADIVGFTQLSERMEPRAVAEMLNEYFSYISSACAIYRGTIDKFIGDCAMIVFGVPQEDPSHPFHAAACGVLIQHLIHQVNEDRFKRGVVPVEFRIGINTGVMLAGNMGSHDRMQYTVVGDAVNLASRLCSHSLPGKVVVAGDFLNRPEVDMRLVTSGHDLIRLRGKSKAVQTHTIDSLSPQNQALMEKQAEVILNKHKSAAA